jgi:four helix bundle protein
MDLAATAYRLARALPLEERFELAAQIRGAAASVPCNIAEGWGRRTPSEFVRYARIANGSVRELQTQVLLSRRLGLVTEDLATTTLAACDTVARQLTALERSLRRRQP